MTEEQTRRRSSLTRVLVIVITTSLGLYAVFGWFIPRERAAARRAEGAADLKNPLLCAERYAAEHDGEFPQLDSEPGRLMFARDAMFPKYCNDPSLVTSSYDDTAPASQFELRNAKYRDAKYIDDHSMYYLGYFLENEAQGLAFVERYRQQVSPDIDFAMDLSADLGNGSFGSDAFIRLSEETEVLTDLLGERFTGVDSVDELKSRIPVFIERPEHYNKPGGFVAYLDGRVKWHDYPGEWPMTKRFIEALESLDRLGPDTNQ